MRDSLFGCFVGMLRRMGMVPSRMMSMLAAFGMFAGFMGFCRFGVVLGRLRMMLGGFAMIGGGGMFIGHGDRSL